VKFSGSITPLLGAATLLTGCDLSPSDTANSVDIAPPELGNGDYLITPAHAPSPVGQFNISVEDSGNGYWQIEGEAQAANASSRGQTEGVYWELPADFEARASGHTIRISVRSRSDAALLFSGAYSTNDVGNSGWQSLNSSTQFETVSFEYDIRPLRDGRGDFFGILTNAESPGQTLEIAWIHFSILPDE
jgi:hypothetical protein